MVLPLWCSRVTGATVLPRKREREGRRGVPLRCSRVCTVLPVVVPGTGNGRVHKGPPLRAAEAIERRIDMSSLFDNLSRLIARPVSRRQTFRLVGEALGGAALAALGLGSASRLLAATCGKQTCTGTQTCCGTGSTAICCNNTQTCCSPVGTKCCNPGTFCCPKGGKVQCCAAGPSPKNPCFQATKCT